MRRAQFHGVLAAILAGACGNAQHHEVVATPPAPRASASIAVEVVDAQAAPPVVNDTPENTDDPRLVVDAAGGDDALPGPPMTPFVAAQWKIVPKDALAGDITFITAIERGARARSIGVAPPDVDAQITERLARTPHDRWNVVLAWVKDGKLRLGNTRSLREALVPIDSIEKAHLLLELGHALAFEESSSGKCFGCAGHVLRATRDGFEAAVPAVGAVQRGPCPHSNAVTSQILAGVRVTTDGRVAVKEGFSGVFPEPQVPRSSHGCVGRDSEGSGRVALEPLTLGDYFAQLAHDESVSVRSFERFADELASAGAHRFARRARRAAGEERRHARMMDRLRARFANAAPRSRTTTTYATRPLEAWLVENACEGCVRETYCAIVAAHQAEHAADDVVRSTFARVAGDEAEHARLAWDVHHWARRVFPDLASTLDAAIARAFDELADHVTTASEAVPFAGEPSREIASAIVSRMRASLAPGPT